MTPAGVVGPKSNHTSRGVMPRVLDGWSYNCCVWILSIGGNPDFFLRIWLLFMDQLLLPQFTAPLLGVFKFTCSCQHLWSNEANLGPPSEWIMMQVLYHDRYQDKT
ncbi:hypothetical protein FEAC_21960 [Ferrimicrobium acidiphilum DSM 19497]|uniref:Uncharacterized protein n=1 Tax=Ferrimicrobium acidiphilum DSM 19497 TaxID=1121877 RepID=A0A0D8FS56_9ACTN|nr:hypothetical protein FEAC_21960 [Ferrimicrobium acidiphilum DSM 19497]